MTLESSFAFLLNVGDMHDMHKSNQKRLASLQVFDLGSAGSHGILVEEHIRR